MKKVALIGGAYDPIHIGHIQMAFETSKLDIFDEVWIMPCYKSGWGKTMTGYYHRLKMCYLAMTYINSITKGNVSISNYEIRNKITGKTYEILERMSIDFPDTEFSIVIGQDNADNIEKWERYNYITEKYQFVVCPRDSKTHKLWYFKNPHILISNKLPTISSSDIRKNIRNDFERYVRYVPPDVLDYIINEGIYNYARK